ncbi:MAG: twin-arginine translocase subunit TatC [Prevotellaceae bacterium]|jgi:sec-independent protein translocase protein TatC|nr:twin-arginine translocase subunit TatC [Prevotellaceae bacterium]
MKSENSKTQTGNEAANVVRILVLERIDAFRKMIFRIAGVFFVCMIIVFANKHLVFDTILFSPASSDFVLYRWLCKLGELLSMPSLCVEEFKLKFQNISISGQFFVHVGTSFWFGLAVSFPWIIYQLWKFAAPIMNKKVREITKKSLVLSSALFFAGITTGYFLVVPLAVKFLGLYQVADAVKNIITLTSYIDTFVMLVIGMGLAFQFPLIILALSHIGILHRSFLKKYRRHAIIVITIIAAIVTPTPDPMTMIIMSAPLVLLYEISIYFCKK